MTAFFYAAIIAAEEAYLRDKFGGEFDPYCARVNRILPRLSGLLGTVRGMHFNWFQLLVKDYNQFFMSVLFLAALVRWDDYVISGQAGLPSSGDVLMFLVPWAILYLAVFVLKKTRRLEGDRAERARPA